MNYGGGGGGFMPGSQGGGGGSQGGGKRQSNHTHRPVTIRQILEAYQPHPDAEFRIDEVEVEHVTFVGNITNLVRSTTNASAAIEDGTGTIDVRMWIESADDDSSKLEGLEQGVYVRVIGGLKAFNNKRSVNATVIRPVTDYNEINYHLLEALYVHLYHTRGPPNLNGGGAGNGAGAMQGIQRTGDRPANNAYTNNAQSNVVNNTYSELKPLAQKIMMHIDRIGADNLPADGLHVEAIAKGISAPRGQVENEIEDLLAEGLLYTTSDSEHVLPTTM